MMVISPLSAQTGVVKAEITMALAARMKRLLLISMVLLRYYLGYW
jgi:hypothetical protein